MPDDQQQQQPPIDLSNPAALTAAYQQYLQYLQQVGNQRPAQAPAVSQASIEANAPTSLLGQIGEGLAGGPPTDVPMSAAQREAAGTRALFNFSRGLLGTGTFDTIGQALARGETEAERGQYSQEAQIGYQQAAAQDWQRQQMADRLAALKESIPLLQGIQRMNMPPLYGPGSGPGAQAGNAPGTVPGAPGGGDIYSLPKAQFLQAVAQRESGGNPTILNYVARADPSAYARGATASGKYQMVNSTWLTAAKAAGIDTTKYPTAMSAPEELQDKAASALYDMQGTAPWNPARFGANWVQQPGGGYQLVKGAAYTPPPGQAGPAQPPAAPGALTAGSPVTAAPSAPGVPVPPGGKPGEATGPYVGGGVGTVLPEQQAAVNQARATGKEVLIPGGSGAVAKPDGTIGPPSGSVIGGKKTADIIQQGQLQAQAQPVVPGTVQAAGPAAGSPPPAARPAAEPGWGTVVGSYGSAPTAPGPQPPPGSVPPTQQPPAQPPAQQPPAPQAAPTGAPAPKIATTPEEYAALHPANGLDQPDKATIAHDAQAVAAAQQQLQDIRKGIVGGDATKAQDAVQAALNAQAQHIADAKEKYWSTVVMPGFNAEQTRQLETQKASWRPMEPSDFAAHNITPEPGVTYLINPLGETKIQQTPIDPRLQKLSEIDAGTFNTDFQQPHIELMRLRPLMDQMDALRQQMIRDGSMNTGATGDTIRHLQGILVSAGLGTEGMREGLSNAQAYQALAQQLVLAMKQNTGLSRITNYDLQILQQQIPGMYQSAGGQQIISGLLRQLWDYQDKVYGAASSSLHDRSTGYTLSGLDDRVGKLPDAIPKLPPEALPQNGKGGWNTDQLTQWRQQHGLLKGQVFRMPNGDYQVVGN